MYGGWSIACKPLIKVNPEYGFPDINPPIGPFIIVKSGVSLALGVVAIQVGSPAGTFCQP